MGEVLKTRNETNTNVWQPPRGNVIKINFDASFNQNYHKSISGIIAQNKEGLVMASCTYPWENISDLTMAEARACLQAVVIIKKLISAVKDRSCIRSLIQEIKGRTSKFRSLQFKHIPREANKAAHRLVLEGRKYDGPPYWMEEVPLTVEELVNRDKNRYSYGI
ncbi:hypothetical protein Godav_001367 [Gossypium davidsonii]|uniref:RNase H type-1 domain-containing protein n=1 Tax=Gossypium davidsonii TaxID=34287 RepID=A0A7J8T4F3_GOSDV|nr:hypothetical protein [Gossypium davidsonii]